MPKSQQKVSKENNKMPKGDRSPKVGQIKWRLFAVWELFRCLTIEVFALPESHSGKRCFLAGIREGLVSGEECW